MKMTPEKAAEILLYTEGKFNKQEYEAFNMAMKALEQVPEILNAVSMIRAYRNEHSAYSDSEIEREIYRAYENCLLITQHLADEWDDGETEKHSNTDDVEIKQVTVVRQYGQNPTCITNLGELNLNL